MDIKDVENLARLARIDLNEEEKKELLSDMKGILNYVKIIEKVETNNVVLIDSLKNVWREDDLNFNYHPYDDLSLNPMGFAANLPAGCASLSGYSPTTGEKCDGTGVGSIHNQFPDSQDGFLKVKKIL